MNSWYKLCHRNLWRQFFPPRRLKPKFFSNQVQTMWFSIFCLALYCRAENDQTQQQTTVSNGEENSARKFLEVEFIVDFGL